MAERKSGPVKPPVIDLKAREPAAPSARGASPHPPATPVPPPHEGEGVRTESSGAGPEGTTTESAAAAPSRLSGGGTARSAVGGEPHAPTEEGTSQAIGPGAPHTPASPVPPPHEGEG